jgi:rhamnose utilization protein RhaD (predicted bifunctional aldolase and dehydrogenase)/NAD(P)-dependent dehydrogenase (short-subunit alcohol dehydrogenase family)
MKSRYVERDASEFVERYGARGVSPDMALRVYTSRLLGGDPRLVLHGGGNTSVKSLARDLMNEPAEVLHVKGSGWDMAAIEPEGLPAVRLAPLRKARTRDALSDEEMVALQRANLLDPAAPTPSVETLLHAFIPQKYVDHTHATAILSLVDQPNGEDICRELFGPSMGIVPYIMPGFALAKLAGDVVEKAPAAIGLILHKHGLFTFGETALEAYERTIEMVSLAEARLARNRKAVFVSAQLPQRVAALSDVAPIIRGACAIADPAIDGAYRRFVLEFRATPAIENFVNGAELDRYARRGVVTPDHTIRTKNWPLIVPAPPHDNLAQFETDVKTGVATFIDNYKAYFERHNRRAGGKKRMLDPAPRIVMVPGLGMFGLGRTLKDARIAADVAESAIEAITDAEAIGTFESISEADMFDMEYWSLEQAKLGKATEGPLAGQIAVVTGAAGAIGAATARLFASAGATVALLDVDDSKARTAAAAIGGSALAIACDVTDANAIAQAFEKVVGAFGGLDILISNAGAAWQGRIGEVDEAILRKSFELNFFAHQRVAQAAVRIMLAQGTGGCLLFNVSKQAVNPGRNFGPYGLPKAATLALVRQYALDYGADGIRANAVNADRIRSGLLDDSMIKARSSARGVSEQEYMSGNLLGREVTAQDVAQAFLAQALALKTTADVATVDGGNIAAALR